MQSISKEQVDHEGPIINVSPIERVASFLGGVALVAWGVQRMSGIRIASALVGVDMIRRGATGHSYLYRELRIRTNETGQKPGSPSVPHGSGLRVDASVTINQSRTKVYRAWRNLTSFPAFVRHLDSVSVIAPNRYRWTMTSVAGHKTEWDAEIVTERDNELLAWRSLPGADVGNAGSVHFEDAPEGRGTVVRVEMEYNPPAGLIGAAAAQILGTDPGKRVREALQQFKVAQEAGQVLNEEKIRDAVDEAGMESFPASDSPAY